MPNAPADLEDALTELGIDVWRSTDEEVTALCPAHERRTGAPQRHATWSVNRHTGLMNCFSCGFKGTFIDLVMELLFPNDVFRAARWVRQFGVSLASARELVPYDEREQREEAPTILVPETRLAMYDDPPAWALEERMLSAESCQHYGVRWDSRHESWIIPVRTPTGELAGWQEKWQKRKRFINDPKDMKKSLCLFGFDVFPVGEPAVLLESPLDVPRLYTAGWEGGLSFFGAAWSQQQMRLVEAVTDEAVSALDNDKEGRVHAERLRVGDWDKGKQMTPGWAGRLHLRFLSYEGTDAKDVGAMSEDEIQRALYDAQHSTVARPLGASSQETRRGIQRGAQALSNGGRRQDGRPRDGARDGRRRNGKDALHHRRSGGTARGVR